MTDSPRNSMPANRNAAQCALRDPFTGLPSTARVTMVRTGGLGDTILLLPTLEILRLACVDVTFALIGSVWAEALQPLLPFAARALHVDRVFPPPRHGGETANLFAASHAVIVYTAAPDSDLVAHVKCACPGPVVIWPVAPAGDRHAAHHLASAVACVPSDAEVFPKPTLVCPPELRLRGREWLDERFGRGVRPLAFHPGSGGRRKCWPAGRFAAVARHLDAPIVLIEGPADADACRAFSHLARPSGPVVRVTDPSLPVLAAVLTECRGLLGNDSGVSHLAAALGIPTLAVFGPTDPAIWAPIGPRVATAAPRGDDPWPTVEEVCAMALRLFDGRTTEARA